VLYTSDPKTIPRSMAAFGATRLKWNRRTFFTRCGDFYPPPSPRGVKAALLSLGYVAALARKIDHRACVAEVAEDVP